MSIIHKLQWRYATKHFDPLKLVSEEKITEILEATNLSASALGLQPYKFIVLRNKDLQKKLAKYSFQGIEVSNASHLIILATKKEISKKYILEYIERTEKIRNLEIGSMEDVSKLTIDLISKKSKEEIFIWAQKQAYVAMGTLILGAADLKVDMCPMEIINSEKYNEILDLDKQGLHACVVAVLGYRKNGDKDQFLKKTRKELSEMVLLKY